MSRLVQVKLTEIPYPQRMAAARREGSFVGEEERLQLMMAAMFPSDTIYYVRAEAFSAAA